MLNLIDFLAAGFVFALFASVYRKRSTISVRFWLIGWFFIVVHFASLAVPAKSDAAQTAQALVALSTLLLCGISFVLSREESHATRGREIAIGLLLGVPWLGVIWFAVLQPSGFLGAAVCASLAAVSVVFIALRWFRGRPEQLGYLLLVTVGCAVWLVFALRARSTDTVISVVLTQCFGLNAVLLSCARRRFSAGKATTSVGAVAWSLVWVTVALLQHFAPSAVVSPEIWNLPKYIVAAGMILTLFEEEIRSAELASEHYRLLFDGNPHPMWMYDPGTLQFLQVNDAAISNYGYSREEFCSMTLLDVVSREHSPELLARLQDDTPQQLSGPWMHHRSDGSTLQVDVASQPVLQDGRGVMFALMHDVTERQRLHAQLIRQAHHDVLTDLPNRALFEQLLRIAVVDAAETDRKVAVFCIDLDRFKQINDSYGHAAGDLSLKAAAARISAQLGERGVLARSGGDEFMLFMADQRQAGDAEVFASDLLRELRTPVEFGGVDLELGASIGFALYPDDGREIEQLWRDADAAMYQAKRAGGGQWVRVSSEISLSANQANEIEISLRRALKGGEFEAHYQPQLTMNGRLYSLEALFRSTDPFLQHVAPDRMIAIAEESGLIVPIGNWMLDAVCRQMRAWLDEGLAPVQVAVNVSPLQLTRFDFSRQVARTLERYRLSARMLEFEVTESTMMPDRGGDAPHQIATLARMGIRFSVDDFGTGYSSLGRLHQLPVDSLKIDCSFTRRIADFNGTFPTVEAITSLAHTFGMKVVAEGVENEEQLRLLKALGCDRVQGYLFSRPLQPSVTTEFLRGVEDDSAREIVA